MRPPDDAGRFERAWRALRERAARQRVPELHAEGYAEIAERGAALLETDGLDPPRQRAVSEWWRVHGEQTLMAEAVRTLPDRTAAWRERRAADLPLDEHGAADPVDPACRAWREEGQALRDEAGDMLEAESLHAPHMGAISGAREAVGTALAEVDGALLEDRFHRFAWLARHVVQQAKETGTEPFHLPRCREAIAYAQTLSGEEALPEDRSRHVDAWLDYHEKCTRLCEAIRNWPERAEALPGEWPRPERDLGQMRSWRQRAEPLLAGARAMQADGSPHAPHLAAMPDERKKLVEIETEEMDRYFGAGSRPDKSWVCAPLRDRCEGRFDPANLLRDWLEHRPALNTYAEQQRFAGLPFLSRVCAEFSARSAYGSIIHI